MQGKVQSMKVMECSMPNTWFQIRKIFVKFIHLKAITTNLISIAYTINKR